MEKSFEGKGFIVSKTDTKGCITYGNSLFIEMSGYEEEELIDAPHNILRHQDMPAVVFELLWETVAQGKEIFAYVKNLSKNGDHYWVFAHVTPSFDAQGRIIGYHSTRHAPRKSALEKIIPLYDQLLKAERNGGTHASRNLLNSTLSQARTSYAKFILSL